MARRTSSQQATHDDVVEKVAQLNRQSYRGRIYTNPNGKQNLRVTHGGREAYPDIVLLPTSGQSVVRIGEIETAEKYRQLFFAQLAHDHIH